MAIKPTLSDFMKGAPEKTEEDAPPMPELVKSGVWFRFEDNLRLKHQAANDRISLQRMIIIGLNMYLESKGQPPIMNHNGKPP